VFTYEELTALGLGAAVAKNIFDSGWYWWGYK